MRLLRPYISVETRFRVALRQLGEMWPDEVVRVHQAARSSMKVALNVRLLSLATLLGCEVSELRLDHDPPLGARRKVFSRAHRGRHQGDHIGYDPPANSIEHLRYRPHAARHAGSHDVKTRVRGDRGQLSDISLVKRNRRLEEQEGTRPKSYRTRMREARAARAKTQVKRPIKGRSQWPPKGSRKFGGRR